MRKAPCGQMVQNEHLSVHLRCCRDCLQIAQEENSEAVRPLRAPTVTESQYPLTFTVEVNPSLTDLGR